MSSLDGARALLCRWQALPRPAKPFLGTRHGGHIGELPSRDTPRVNGRFRPQIQLVQRCLGSMAVEDDDVDLYGDLPEPPKLAPPTAPKAVAKAVLNPALASHNGVSHNPPALPRLVHATGRGGHPRRPGRANPLGVFGLAGVQLAV